ncbi:ABC transporter permease subunit [Vagococcus lutrae]|uniref:ABC transporter permease subunit n=1 Tax=Vagococcus lutrae TaxID=81947 RepID=A0AAE9XMB1_9ENTE|nr:ABC transporter permease subunit [Vagococcus lutrae]MDT2805675.1 ABC transporter permease subunit [Vagococcus lutrae]MDY3705437.1 ABC transporter permease subunit [Vagococcus lutrae]UQF18941.1 ABC transporter permease subunit [Vagococcus lutrae]UQF23201.1 ABC transporter permease subunit [Vagococcus lutrae]UQF38535.1 ABC transporter permease subunit [Vagococcus lutrae]
MEMSVNKNKKKNTFLSAIKRDWELYLLLLPGILFLFVFNYIPIGGVTIAFQDFNIFKGISGSEWVGLDNFRRLFSSAEFMNIFKNTMIISVLKLVFLFPLPIVLALLLNEIRNMQFKKTIQTVIYLPHFISWVIVTGLFVSLLSVNGGIVNVVIEKLGGHPIPFFMSKEYFRSLLVFTEGWKEVGWGTIVYLAAITGVDEEQYEAARIDGANRFQQIMHVTIPSISSTIVLMFILRIGRLLEAGTEQILVMYNPVVYDVADVIGTYVYRVGMGTSDYSFSTAVGLFNSVINFALIVLGNKMTKKFFDSSIW